MKRLFAILLPLLATVSTACWNVDEEWSSCVTEGNLELCFHLPDTPDSEFVSHIDRIDVYLFDEELNFVQSRRISKPELVSRLQSFFTVTPGTYHVVCWANVGESSQVVFENNHISGSYIKTVSQRTGNPVYYAPYKIPGIHPADDTRTDHFDRSEIDYSDYKVHVEWGKHIVKEMAFVKVHRTVEVFVSNWPHRSPPIVERTGAGGRFDFLLRAYMTGFINFSRPSAPMMIDGSLMYYTHFHSALIPLEGEHKTVYLCDPATGEYIEGTEIDLEMYVKEQGIEDDSYIPIHYRFGDVDVGVSISLPAWQNNDMIW